MTVNLKSVHIEGDWGKGWKIGFRSAWSEIGAGGSVSDWRYDNNPVWNANYAPSARSRTD